MRANELPTSVTEGPNDPDIFKAIFLAGGPGSGKSFVSGKLLTGTGLKTINSDDIYEYLAKKNNLDLSNPDVVYSKQGQDVRDRAKQLTGMRKSGYLEGRLGVIIDGTGKDVAKVKQDSDALKELGYDTMMLFVNTSLNVAQQRNKMRSRQRPSENVTSMWEKVQQNIMQFQQVFGAKDFHVIDNSGGLEDPDRAKNFNVVRKEIKSFLDNKNYNHIAKQWIKANSTGTNENISQTQLNGLEAIIDRAFSNVGIDVEFTRHFLQRANDDRNGKPITIKELGQIFAKEYKRWGKPIAQMGPDSEAVMKDLESDVNVPFALRWNGKELELIAKTVMRKKNFKTSNKEFEVNEDFGSVPPLVDLLAIALAARVSVGTVKALFKTAKGINRLRKAAHRAGVDLSNYIQR